jgi:hypothetical protein
MPGQLGPGPRGRGVRPGVIAEPGAESVRISAPVAACAADSHAQCTRHAAAEFTAEPGAESACSVQSVAERTAGPRPGAQHVLSGASTSPLSQDELHNEPEWRS